MLNTYQHLDKIKFTVNKKVIAKHTLLNKELPTLFQKQPHELQLIAAIWYASAYPTTALIAAKKFVENQPSCSWQLEAQNLQTERR